MHAAINSILSTAGWGEGKKTLQKCEAGWIQSTHELKQEQTLMGHGDARLQSQQLSRLRQ